jgi:hypothetical protein
MRRYRPKWRSASGIGIDTDVLTDQKVMRKPSCAFVNPLVAFVVKPEVFNHKGSPGLHKEHKVMALSVACFWNKLFKLLFLIRHFRIEILNLHPVVILL